MHMKFRMEVHKTASMNRIKHLAVDGITHTVLADLIKYQCILFIYS